MIQKVEVIHCTNTKMHSNNVWVKMEVGQFEPDRRISFHCPECNCSIVIDYLFYKGSLLTSGDK